MIDEKSLAQVISVRPNNIIVEVSNLEDFKIPNEGYKVYKGNSTSFSDLKYTIRKK